MLQRLRTAASTQRRPARGPVDDLRRYDATHATQYRATLRAWLEAQGDLVDAARRLAVHQNTIRYRLRKMTEITSLDLEDPAKRFAMLIELATTD
jgi:DNA-binding PucR family transcriptional regulator